MDRTVRALTLIALLAAPLLATAAPATHTRLAGDSRSEGVRYSDLNLATPGGVATLQRRIDLAVERVCDLPNAKQPAQRARIDDCRTEVRSQAVARARQVVQESQALARGH